MAKNTISEVQPDSAFYPIGTFIPTPCIFKINPFANSPLYIVITYEEIMHGLVNY